MLHHKTLSVYKRDFYSHVFANPVRHIYIYIYILVFYIYIYIYIYIVYIQTFNILQKCYN